MKKHERLLIQKAIECFHSDGGYFDGMLILNDLIGNTAYRKNMDMLDKIVPMDVNKKKVVSKVDIEGSLTKGKTYIGDRCNFDGDISVIGDNGESVILYYDEYVEVSLNG